MLPLAAALACWSGASRGAPPTETAPDDAGVLVGCLVEYAPIDGLTAAALRSAMTLEARKAHRGNRVTLARVADGQACGAMGDGAVRVLAWPGAVVEVEVGTGRMRLPLADVAADRRADVVARTVVEMLEPAPGQVTLVPAAAKREPPPVVAARPPEAPAPVSTSYDDGMSYDDKVMWLALGGVIDAENRGAFDQIHPGFEVALAAVLLDGRMDIGAWVVYYPTTSVVEGIDESGVGAGLFAGYNHILPLAVELRFRLGMGVSWRHALGFPGTHAVDASGFAGAIRAEVEARIRFVPFAHVGLHVGARVYTNESISFRASDQPFVDDLIPGPVGGGVFGLRMGVDL